MRVSVLEVADQKAALRKLAALVEKSTVDPLVRNAALAITSDCDQRDDECEVRAVFDAVKHGDDRVQGLEHGLKYMSDPRWADFFSSPSRTLKQLSAGYNGEDCDGHSALIAALLGSLGFVTGLRAWGRSKGDYTHVYAVVALPKIPPAADEVGGYRGFGRSQAQIELVGLDTTVDESEVGWEPEGGFTLTALLDGT